MADREALAEFIASLGEMEKAINANGARWSADSSEAIKKLQAEALRIFPQDPVPQDPVTEAERLDIQARLVSLESLVVELWEQEQPNGLVTQSMQFKWTMGFLLLGCIPSMMGVYAIAWVDETKDGCTYANVKGGPIQSLSIMCVSATMLLFMMLSRYYIASSKGYWVRGLLYKREKEKQFRWHVWETRLRGVCGLLLLTWFGSTNAAVKYRKNIVTCHTDGVYGFFVYLPTVVLAFLLVIELLGRWLPGPWTEGKVESKVHGNVDGKVESKVHGNVYGKVHGKVEGYADRRTIQTSYGKLRILGITLVMWAVVVGRQYYLFDSDARNACAALGIVGFQLFPLLLFSTAVYVFVLASSFLVDNAHAFTGLVLSVCAYGYTVFAVQYVFITKASKARSCDSRARVELLDWLILVFAGLVVAGISVKNRPANSNYLPVQTDFVINRDAREIEVLQLRF
jgi:hypothetical protein